MPHMNGFELSEKLLAMDINVKVRFMSSAEINQALREISPWDALSGNPSV
jgi:hypothetical protein